MNYISHNWACSPV